jgi:2,3-dihydroxyphenylpropionate 1,2-dioxygenase
MMNLPIPKDHDRVARFKLAVAEFAARLRAAKPDVLVIFGPDHFRALFYDLMPAFTIGIDRVAGWGDWNTPVGPFLIHPRLANHVVRTCLAHDIDITFSYDLKVDHGVTQPLQLMQLEDLPIVPIIVNSAGVPLPHLRRCHQLGEIVRRAIASFDADLQVAIIASGGLSHDPPKPSAENTLHGRTNGFAGSRERETRLMNIADQLQSRINVDWDRHVLSRFVEGQVAELTGEMTEESIFAAAGNGAQEIRTWIAMAGALADSPMRVLSYEPIDALITGMGVITT